MGDHEYYWVFPKIGVPPKHPTLIGFSIINHPFWGIPIFGNTLLLMVQKSGVHQLRPGKYIPLFTRFQCMLGGCLGFLPSTVSIHSVSIY